MFPGQQGGPLEHVIAAKAVAFKIAASELFAERQRRTVEGARALARELLNRPAHGVNVLTGGTDVHLILVDLRETQPALTGKQAEERLHEIQITVNRNAVPFDPRPPIEASGLRIGTPALATRGLQQEDFDEIGRILAVALSTEYESRAGELAERVGAIVERYPLYESSARRPRPPPRRCRPRRLRPPGLRCCSASRWRIQPSSTRFTPSWSPRRVTALLTPLTMRLREGGRRDRRAARARPVRASRRRCSAGWRSSRGRCVAGLIWLPAGYARKHQPQLWHGVLIAAAVITLVGALDDRFDLHPAVKLLGQVLAAVIVVHFGVAVKAITLPFIGQLHFPNTGPADAGPVLTVIGLVVMMNVVNFSDGVDGLAAGVCAIIAAAMAVIAFDLNRQQPGVLAALTAGRGARLPDLQLPARVELHGRLRREPARPADGRASRWRQRSRRRRWCPSCCR